MFIILSKDQHNRLQAIAEAKGLRNTMEALSWMLEKVSNPFMEEYAKRKAASAEERRAAFEKRRRASRKGGHTQPARPQIGE